MWDGSVQGKKIKCLNGCGILKYPHIINSSMASFYTTIFF